MTANVEFFIHSIKIIHLLSLYFKMSSLVLELCMAGCHYTRINLSQPHLNVFVPHMGVGEPRVRSKAKKLEAKARDFYISRLAGTKPDQPRFTTIGSGS